MTAWGPTGDAKNSTVRFAYSIDKRSAEHTLMFVFITEFALVLF